MNVAALFDALDDEGRASLERELARPSTSDLANDIREAAQVLEGLCVAGEAVSFFTYMVLTDCRARVHEAAERADVGIGF